MTDKPTVLCQSTKMQLNNCEVTRVVLRHVGGFQPFVTHIEVFPEGRESFCIEGHYFDDLEAAVADFGSRSKRDLVRQIGQLEGTDALLCDLAAL